MIPGEKKNAKYKRSSIDWLWVTNWRVAFVVHEASNINTTSIMRINTKRKTRTLFSCCFSQKVKAHFSVFWLITFTSTGEVTINIIEYNTPPHTSYVSRVSDCIRNSSSLVESCRREETLWIINYYISLLRECIMWQMYWLAVRVNA